MNEPGKTDSVQNAPQQGSYLKGDAHSDPPAFMVKRQEQDGHSFKAMHLMCVEFDPKGAQQFRRIFNESKMGRTKVYMDPALTKLRYEGEAQWINNPAHLDIGNPAYAGDMKTGIMTIKSHGKIGIPICERLFWRRDPRCRLRQACAVD